jgi:hypothetical protein
MRDRFRDFELVTSINSKIVEICVTLAAECTTSFIGNVKHTVLSATGYEGADGE